MLFPCSNQDKDGKGEGRRDVVETEVARLGIPASDSRFEWVVAPRFNPI